MTINLIEFCRKNNMRCKTCSESYKNYFTLIDYHLYCNGIKVFENNICIYWKSHNKEHTELFVNTVEKYCFSDLIKY